MRNAQVLCYRMAAADLPIPTEQSKQLQQHKCNQGHYCLPQTAAWAAIFQSV